ncbi:hypothetical protein KC19_2G190600 [Ceratodon purpureus]|uniref:Uncharacterized protein n=1 Tax=Ceratodon purpureus TaxID=3225 RepID=A0A8T0IX57_CERPU|nr:hypothetical protein KC19_2G190600 [Ceratodon purpureus]
MMRVLPGNENGAVMLPLLSLVFVFSVIFFWVGSWARLPCSTVVCLQQPSLWNVTVASWRFTHHPTAFSGSCPPSSVASRVLLLVFAEAYCRTVAVWWRLPCFLHFFFLL